MAVEFLKKGSVSYKAKLTDVTESTRPLICACVCVCMRVGGCGGWGQHQARKEELKWRSMRKIGVH